MILAMWYSMMTEHEYMTLANKRDELVGLEKKATLRKHVEMIREQLKEIRMKLKQAHYERYKQTGQH